MNKAHFKRKHRDRKSYTTNNQKGSIRLIDNGFGMLKTFLAYKLAEQGKQLVKIDEWYPSSKLCSVCKTINTDLTLADRTWSCKHRSAEIDRDINAAINIKNEGCRIPGIA